MSRFKKLKEFETSLAHATVYESNLLVVRVRGGRPYPIEEVKANYRQMYEETGGQQVAVLVDTSAVRYTDISGEILRFMASNEFVPVQLANALLVNNVAVRRIANIYLELFHPRVPTRIFTEEEKAWEWLETKIQPHEPPR